MNVTSATGEMIEINLRQLGATKVECVNGKLYYVKFRIDENITVSYCYNINAKDQYFLQRISPYPLPEGLFSTQEQIINFIKRDIKKFRNAKNSSNFSVFVELVNTIYQTQHAMEDLFLDYNVKGESIKELKDELEKIIITINKTQAKSEHVIL